MMDGRRRPRWSYLVLLLLAIVAASASTALTKHPEHHLSPSSSSSSSSSLSSSSSSLASLVYMTAGMPGRLDCPIDAEPPNRLILWQKDGQMVDVSSSDDEDGEGGAGDGGGQAVVGGQGRRRGIELDGTLVIERVSSVDDGSYSCMSYSPLETGYASAAFDVIVKDLHYFTTRPLPVYHRLVGESVLMPCATEGDPQPTITWKKLDGDFPATTKTLQDEGNLTIVQLSREDEGMYACIATNIVTSIITTTLLVVQIRIFAAPFNVTVDMTSQSARLSWIPPYENGHYVLWFRRKQSIRDNDDNNNDDDDGDDDDDDGGNVRYVREGEAASAAAAMRRRLSVLRGGEEEKVERKEDGEDAEDEGGAEDWQTMEMVNSQEVTSMTVYGLRPSTVYSFMLMSRDSHGHPHFSEQVIATTDQGLFIYGNNDDRRRYDYDDNKFNVDGQEAETEELELEGFSGEERTECHDDSSCDEHQFDSDIRPSPPIDLSVHLLPDNRVNISWSAPRRTLVPVRHYVVEYRTTGGEWKTVIDRLPARNTSLLWTTPSDDLYGGGGGGGGGVFHFRVFSFGGSLHSIATPVIHLITRDESGGEIGASSSSSADMLAWETVGGVVVGLLLFCVSVILAILAVGIYKRRQQPFKQNLMQQQQPQQQQQQLHGVYQYSREYKYGRLSKLEPQRWSQSFFFLCNPFGLAQRIGVRHGQLRHGSHVIYCGGNYDYNDCHTNCERDTYAGAVGDDL